MTSPGNYEGRTAEPTREEVVIGLFRDSQAAFEAGEKRYRYLAEDNPHSTKIKGAVGGLATHQLVDLLAIGETQATEGQDITAFAKALDRWTRFEKSRMMHENAYSEYARRQNKEVNKILEGKRLTVTAREGTSHRTIAPFDGSSTTWADSNPREVSGQFYRADVSIGEMIILMDEPQPSGDNCWFVEVFSKLPGQERAQLAVDIMIEEPELPEAA